MKEFMRIVGITIEGIKNVCHGSIKINATNNKNEEDFSKIRVYSWNIWSKWFWKINFLEATDILKICYNR